MEKSLVLSSEAFPVTFEDGETFSNICLNIKTDIADRKMISERTILDFSRFTAKMLYGGVSSELPRPFLDLVYDVEDYWRYSAKSDRNKERCFNYIRIYQITSMVRIADVEERRNMKLSDEARIGKNKGNYEILSYVYHSPGITHKALSAELGITVSALSQKAARLEESGYLFSRRSGRNKVYSLSNYGISLYKRISNIHNESDTKISKEHLEFAIDLFNAMPKKWQADGLESKKVAKLLKDISKVDAERLAELRKKLYWNHSDNDTHEYYQNYPVIEVENISSEDTDLESQSVFPKQTIKAERNWSNLIFVENEV